MGGEENTIELGGTIKRKSVEDDHGEVLLIYSDFKGCNELKFEHSKTTIKKKQ